MSDTVEIADQNSIKKVLAFQFKGEGFEYFKIWIVNTLLTIVTLGIYSAWAKVRNNRYFYSNLYLDEDNFRYLAEPLTILKGRIIAVVVLLIYSVVSTVSPVAGIVMAILFLVFVPLLVNRSLAFNNRMSAFKNIQFSFKGSYGEAFMALLVWPIIGILTLGILYPMAILKVNQYVVRNSAYGTSKFEFHATFKDYGIIFLTMLGVLLLFGIPVGLLAAFVPDFAPLVTLPMLVAYFAVFVYFTVAVTNLYYRSATLITHSFQSDLTMGGYARVMLINGLLIVITFGLYLPAAKVRMTKYLVSCIQFNADGSLDNFAAAEQENISALGEEFGEVFDFGI